MPRLKFDTNKLPYSLEIVLKEQYGFNKSYYNYHNATIIFERTSETKGPVAFNDLSENVITDLLQRLNRIIDGFKDLESNRAMAAQRCRTMASCLEPKARAFCYDWIKRNLEDAPAYGATKQENLKLELLS